MKKTYSKEIKLKTVQEYKKGRKLRDIADDYGITAKSLILEWNHLFNKNGEDAFSPSKEKSESEARVLRLKISVDKKNDEIKELKAQLEQAKLANQNHNLTKQLLEKDKEIKKALELVKKKEKENEILKKSMTSSLRKLVIIKSDKKYSKKEIHKIYELVATWVELGNDAKSMLAIYEITEKSYSNWIKKGNPPFNRKFNPKHIEIVKEFCSKKGNDIGLKKTQIKFNKELNLKLSIPLIQFAKSLINLPKKQNYERRKKQKVLIIDMLNLI